MKRARRFLCDEIVLLLAALLVRLIYVLSIRSEPLFDHPQVDARVFWEAAAAIASGGGEGAVYYRPPLFGALVSLIVRLFGEDAGRARIALILLSALAAPLTARIARPVAGRTGALLAGALAALYAPAVFYGGEILPASTVLLLNLFLLAALLSAERKKDVRLYGAAGLLLGLSALTRPTILLFLPLLLFRYRRLGRASLFLLLGAVVAIAPATLHNLLGGDLVLISSNGGLNYYMGNHDGADGKSARAPELPNEPGEARRAARAIAQGSAGEVLRPSEVSSYWFGRGFHSVARNPGSWLGLTGRKLYFLLNDREISDNVDFRAVEERSAPLRLVPFRFGLLFALSLAGLRLLGRSPQGRLLLLYGLAVALPPILFFVVGRFRLPLLPLLAVAGALGLAQLASGLRRSPRVVLPSLLVVGAGFGLSQSGFFGAREDMSWHYYYLCGDALFRKGRMDEATGAFEESLRRSEAVPMTRNALGFLYAETGRNLDRAERLVRGAIELEPVRRRFYLDSLGWILFQQGDLEGAAGALVEAIPLFAGEEAFSKAEALGHLAQVRRAQGRREEARRLEQEAERWAKHDQRFR